MKKTIDDVCDGMKFPFYYRYNFYRNSLFKERDYIICIFKFKKENIYLKKVRYTDDPDIKFPRGVFWYHVIHKYNKVFQEINCNIINFSIL